VRGPGAVEGGRDDVMASGDDEDEKCGLGFG